MVMTGKGKDNAVRVGELARILNRSPADITAQLPVPQKMRPGMQHFKIPPTDVRHVLAACGVSFQFQSLAFINLKGGVGKTTSSLAIAARAAQLGFRTCLLDLDAQASATLALGVKEEYDGTVFNDLWQTPGKIADALQSSPANISYLPSSLDNSLLDISLINPSAQKNAVAGIITEIRKLGFDLAIVDCPPSLGGAVISTVCAADKIIIPVTCDAFSQRGLELTINEACSIRETFGLPPPDLLILPTMLDRRSALTEPFLLYLQNKYGNKLLTGGIGTSTVFSRILEKRQTLYDGGVRRTSAHRNYDQAAQELLLNELNTKTEHSIEETES